MSIVNSRLCKLIGLKYPIIQAGMGPFPTTDLAIASANAGALGVMCTAAIGMKGDMPAIFKHFCKAAGASEDDTPEVIARKMYRKAFEKTRGCPGALAPNVMVAVESKATAEIAIGTLIKMREEDPEFKASFRVLITSAGDPMPWGK
jgi:enoyl-[acyl-carrier protein] reductase II